MWYVCVYKCVHTHTPKMECYAAKKKKNCQVSVCFSVLCLVTAKIWSDGH